MSFPGFPSFGSLGQLMGDPLKSVDLSGRYVGRVVAGDLWYSNRDRSEAIRIASGMEGENAIIVEADGLLWVRAGDKLDLERVGDYCGFDLSFPKANAPARRLLLATRYGAGAESAYTGDLDELGRALSVVEDAGSPGWELVGAPEMDPEGDDSYGYVMVGNEGDTFSGLQMHAYGDTALGHPAWLAMRTKASPVPVIDLLNWNGEVHHFQAKMPRYRVQIPIAPYKTKLGWAGFFAQSNLGAPQGYAGWRGPEWESYRGCFGLGFVIVTGADNKPRFRAYFHQGWSADPRYLVVDQEVFVGDRYAAYVPELEITPRKGEGESPVIVWKVDGQEVHRWTETYTDLAPGERKALWEASENRSQWNGREKVYIQAPATRLVVGIEAGQIMTAFGRGITAEVMG